MIAVHELDGVAHRLPAGKEARGHGLGRIEAGRARQVRRRVEIDERDELLPVRAAILLRPDAMAGLRWPTANAVPPALSLRVPPSWNVTSEFTAGPIGAPVVQSRSVT